MSANAGVAKRHKKGHQRQMSTLSTTEKVVAWTMRRKHLSESFSGAIQLLLLAHTPVSRKVFQYFHFHDISGRNYLRADYRIAQDSDEWRAFLPVVLVVGLGYVFGLPFIIGRFLHIHRDELYSTSVVQRMGFLYMPFNRGAEFWQIHDLVLKMMLTGMLIFVASYARACVGILIVAIAVANLNYFKPHKQPLIFWLTQLSFAVTIVKYAIGMLLLVMELRNLDAVVLNRVGFLMISLDIVVMVASFMTVYILILELRHKMSALETKRDMNSSTNGLIGNRAGSAVRSARAAEGNEIEGSTADTTDVYERENPTSIVPLRVTAGYEVSTHEKEVNDLRREHNMSEAALLKHQGKLQDRAKRKTQIRLAARLKVRKSKVIHKVPLFSNMAEKDIDTILALMKFETFSEGTVICSQGDFALKFYIVVGGSCTVSVKQPASHVAGGKGILKENSSMGVGISVLEVAKLSALQYFGESCLDQVAKDRRRTATVTAADEGATLLSLHRDDFLKLIQQEVIRCDVISTLRRTQRQHQSENISKIHAS